MRDALTFKMGGSPGLVVMGGDSWSKGHGSNPGAVYWMDILHFSHLFVVKIVMFVWKDENKRKRGRGSPFKKVHCKYYLLKNALVF